MVTIGVAIEGGQLAPPPNLRSGTPGDRCRSEEISRSEKNEGRLTALRQISELELRALLLLCELFTKQSTRISKTIEPFMFKIRVIFKLGGYVDILRYTYMVLVENFGSR